MQVAPLRHGLLEHCGCGRAVVAGVGNVITCGSITINRKINHPKYSNIVFSYNYRLRSRYQDHVTKEIKAVFQEFSSHVDSKISDTLSLINPPSNSAGL